MKLKEATILVIRFKPRENKTRDDRQKYEGKLFQ